MCFDFLFRKKYNPLHNSYTRRFVCSCDLCGSQFNNMKDLITHLGGHTTTEINKVLRANYGIVRCHKCWYSFRTVKDMSEHTCAQFESHGVIQNLTPVGSADSIESVLIREDSPV